MARKRRKTSKKVVKVVYKKAPVRRKRAKKSLLEKLLSL